MTSSVIFQSAFEPYIDIFIIRDQNYIYFDGACPERHISYYYAQGKTVEPVLIRRCEMEL
jgi:hypothetical protein